MTAVDVELPQVEHLPTTAAVARITLQGLGYTVTDRTVRGTHGLLRGTWTILTALLPDTRIDMGFFAPHGHSSKFTSGKLYSRDGGDPQRFAAPAGVMPRDDEQAEPFASLTLISPAEALRQAEVWADIHRADRMGTLEKEKTR